MEVLPVVDNDEVLLPHIRTRLALLGHCINSKQSAKRLHARDLGRLERASSTGIRPFSSVTCCPYCWRAIVNLPMTHFPQPHPSKRAARVQLGDSVLAAIRLEDGRRTKAKLQSISVTGGLLQLLHPLGSGSFVELAFQTQSGPVHGMAELLTPMRKTAAGVLQPFRFVAFEDDDHRRLRTSVDHVSERSLLGLKSSVFVVPKTI